MMSLADDLRALLDRADSDHDAVRIQLDQARTDLFLAAERADTAEARVVALSADLAQTRDELFAAQADLSDALGSNATLRTQVSDLTTRVATLEARIAELEAGQPSTPATLYGYWAGNDENGVNVAVETSYARVGGYLGAPQVYRMFYPGLPQSPFKGSRADFGPPVVVSFKAAPADVIAGKHDAFFTSWFASIPTDRKVWWSFYHEPEDNIEKGEFTAAQYRQAWEHLIALAPKRDTLRATLILMSFSLYKSSRKIDDYVAQGLDVLAWDSYLTANTKTVEGAIDKPRAVSESYGLGFAIAETSVAENYALPGKDRAASMLALVEGLKADTGAEFVTWFESNKSDGDWRMRPFDAAVTAWRG